MKKQGVIRKNHGLVAYEHQDLGEVMLRTAMFEILKEYKENSFKNVIYDSKGVKDSGFREEGSKGVVYVAATGSGKTMAAAFIIEKMLKRNPEAQVMFIVDRRDLAFQTKKEFLSIFEESTVTMMMNDSLESEDETGLGRVAGMDEYNPRASVIIVSWDSYRSWRKRERFIFPRNLSLVFVDEGHRLYQQDMLDFHQEQWQKGIFTVTMTATPSLGKEGKGMGGVGSKMIIPMTAKEQFEKGFTVPYRYVGVSKVMMSEYEQENNEFSEKDQAEVHEIIFSDIHLNWLENANNESTVIFVSSKNHARNIVHKFRESGVIAETILSGEPKHRRSNEAGTGILDRFKRGEITVLVGIKIPTTGLNAPIIRHIVIATLVSSLAEYLQMIGRGSRRFLNKELCTVHDHVGAYLEFLTYTQDRNWSLNESVPNRRGLNSNVKKEDLDIICEGCQRVFVRTNICPFCGYETVAYGRSQRYIEANLVELNEHGMEKKEKKSKKMTKLQKNQLHDQETRLQNFGMMKFIQKNGGSTKDSKGKKFKKKTDFWVAFLYKLMYGSFPPRSFLKEYTLTSPSIEIFSLIRRDGILKRTKMDKKRKYELAIKECTTRQGGLIAVVDLKNKLELKKEDRIISYFKMYGIVPIFANGESCIQERDILKFKGEWAK